MARGYISFFTGLLLSDVLNRCTEKNKKKLDFAAIFIFIGIILLLLFHYDFLDIGLPYILVFFLYPSIVIIFRSNIVSRICRYKVLGVLSAISFDTYIWHEPLTAFRNLLMMKFSWNPDITKLSSMLLFALLAWIIGGISYFFLEKPINAYFQKKIHTVNQ